MLGVFDGTDVHERLLGQVVPFTFANLFAAFDGSSLIDIFTLKPDELLGNKERLGKEFFEFSGAGDDHLVFLAQFIDTENSDDVLQVFVPLEIFENRLRDIVMSLTNHIAGRVFARCFRGGQRQDKYLFA